MATLFPDNRRPESAFLWAMVMVGEGIGAYWNTMPMLRRVWVTRTDGP